MLVLSVKCTETHLECTPPTALRKCRLGRSLSYSQMVAAFEGMPGNNYLDIIFRSAASRAREKPNRKCAEG